MQMILLINKYIHGKVISIIWKILVFYHTQQVRLMHYVQVFIKRFFVFYLNYTFILK
jgi:hypothetical protein